MPARTPASPKSVTWETNSPKPEKNRWLVVEPVTSVERQPGVDCTFSQRKVDDPLVQWQWVVHGPVERVRLAVEGEQVGLRLSPQGSLWTLVVLDASRAADWRERPPPAMAPPWLSSGLHAQLKRQLDADRAPILARHPVDRSVAVRSPERGDEQVMRRGERDEARVPLFGKPTPPMSPVREVWFTNEVGTEPWLFYAADPLRRVELVLRRPGGESTLLFSRPPREDAGGFRVTDLTRVGRVFSMVVDGRHLVLWPRPDGTAFPRMNGVAMPGEAPTTLPPRSPPCDAQPTTRTEERVVTPRLFERAGAPWTAWLSEETTTHWHVAPVLQLDATGEPGVVSCQWVLDRRAVHTSLVVARLVEGQLEERLRLPVFGAPIRLDLVATPEAITLAATAYQHVTVTRLSP
jgi:hypothetical protein